MIPDEVYKQISKIAFDNNMTFAQALSRCFDDFIAKYSKD